VSILQPGVGVGGHCIAVDPWFIVARNEGQAKIIKTAREVNLQKTQWVIQRIRNQLGQISEAGKSLNRVVCLGLSFKPDVDDLRESPALEIVETLTEQGLDVVAIEPNIESHQKVKLISNAEIDVLKDLVVLLVSHKEFSEPEFRKLIDDATKIDFCGAW
jgi:UDP-N-acetyl-D-mannosaminuronic acid dehydrogenase